MSPFVTALLTSLLWLLTGLGLRAQPTIITQPTNYTTCPGGTAEFCVEAQSALPPPRPAAVVSDASGSVTSRLATLTVRAGPSITQQPKGVSVSLGATVVFGAGATTASPPLSYQWQLHGTNLPGQTQTNLILQDISLAQAGSYAVAVSDAYATLVSDSALLDVDTTFTKITGQPIVEDREPSELGAWCDYDGDGYLDLFVANSMNAIPAVRNSLYHNERNGSFTRVTNALTARAVNTFGAQWADYDNDGRPDLFMTHEGGPASELFQNLGGGEFAAVSTPFLLPNQNQVDGAWGDLDGDGWVDLLVATWQMAEDPAFRNLGDGQFQPLTTNEVGALGAEAATTAAPSFADFDNDGDPDVYVSCESGSPFLYRNRGGGIYDKAQLGSLPGNSTTVCGVWGDFNNDGFFDLITTARNGFCTLHMNVGGQTFQDVTTTAGVVAPRGFVWGPAWGDLDNDGDLDLFIPYYTSTNLMFLNNNDGTFTSIDIGSPLREGVNDQCAVWVDYDNDGFLDLFVACGEGNPSPNLLYRNNLPAMGNTNHWLKVQLIGTASNRSAIGAKIRVRAVIRGQEVSQLRQIASNGGFASGTDLVAHFGLGDATSVETVRVEWPSGQVTELHNVSVRQSFTIAEPPTFTRITTGTVVTDLGSSSGVIGDYDGDGYLDIFVGRYNAGISALYHNNGDGTFSSITNGTFPLPVGDFWFGPCSDFDNDGRVDLFVLRGASALSSVYYNNGDGTFASVPLATFDAWYESAADYDHDGLLDLYFTSLGAAVTNRAYRNLGGRSFQPMTSADVGTIMGQHTRGGATWADYDDDGWEDVCVPNPAARHVQLHRNTGNGRFVAITNQLTRDVTGQSFAVAWGDYDNDGRVDLCVAAYGGNSSLYRSLGGDNFERADIGLTIQGTYNAVAWGDYDNDGFLDLFMTYGNDMGNSLFRNNGNGTFTAITNAPLFTDRVKPWAFYAPRWFDYDNDGFLDLFVPTGNDEGTAFTPNFLYHNDTNANAWLKVKLVGTISNREGAGAKVRAKATFAGATRWQRRDITSGDDHYNGSGPIAHFGLGDATNVETLLVEWPSGQVTELHNVPVRQSLTITEAPGLRATALAQETLELQLTAHTGMNVSMEVSSNLVNWVPWQTVPQTNRTVIVTDPEAGQHPQRFYKARVQ